MRGGHPAHEDGIRIGGPRDPVAQSIRREQQADARPSAAEAKREHRQRLSDEGCEVCGADDPAVLTMVRVALTHCRNGQHPDPPFDTVVLCDEHERPSDVLRRARMVQQARNDGADVIGVFDCGATVHGRWTGTVPDGPRFDDVDDVSDLSARGKMIAGAEPPRVPAFHVGRDCGADLDEVIRLDHD